MLLFPKTNLALGKDMFFKNAMLSREFWKSVGPMRKIFKKTLMMLVLNIIILIALEKLNLSKLLENFILINDAAINVEDLSVLHLNEDELEIFMPIKSGH